MARTNENKRHSKYVIRIVCEGDKTEPLFFTDLCDQFYGDSKDFDVRTIPQPNIPVEDAEADSSRGSYKGKKRKVKSGGQKDVAEDEVITGVPPLKWVLYARKIMSEGVDESWAVYDKDEHPKHEEAMTEANKIIDGKKVNIAFSSRSFEYYLLLHFEYLYYSFDATECGERIKGKKQIYECGTGKNPDKDCDGKKCINGYARKHGYWMESKSSVSTFPLVKDKLLKGMINACRLRTESDSKTDEPIYKRNPYTNVDILVGRLIEKETVSYGTTYTFRDHGSDWSVRLDEKGLNLTNNKDGSEIFQRGMFIVYDWEKNTKKELNEKSLLLGSGETDLLSCTLTDSLVLSIKISPKKEVLLLPKFIV
jgi:hypothetical protein